MDLNQLRKLAGLPHIMEAANVPPKVERAVDKLGDLLGKINEHNAALKIAFKAFDSYLQTSSSGVFSDYDMSELLDLNHEAKGNLEQFIESIELCERELRDVLDQDG